MDVRYLDNEVAQVGDTVRCVSGATCMLHLNKDYTVTNVVSEYAVDIRMGGLILCYHPSCFNLISRKEKPMKFKITNGQIRPKTYFKDLKIGEWFQGTGKNSQFKAVKIAKESYSNSVCYYEDGRGAEGYFSPDEEVIRILDVELSGRLEV